MKQSLFLIFLINFIIFIILFFVIAHNNFQIAIGIGLAMIFGVLGEIVHMLGLVPKGGKN